MYFESPQQLFTLMIQDGLIARRGQAKVVSNDSEKFGDLWLWFVLNFILNTQII